MSEEKKELLAVCPFSVCNKVIFRKAIVVTDSAKPTVMEFETRCPHCGNSVKVKIGIRIETQPIW